MFIGNGKKKDVIIKILPRQTSSDFMGGTVTLEYDRLDIWADVGHLQNLKKVPGVMEARISGVPVNYWVFVDPRYDTNWVIKEIEAMLQIELPSKKKSKKEETTFPGLSDYMGELGE